MSDALYATIESSIRPTKNSAIICSLFIPKHTGEDILAFSLGLDGRIIPLTPPDKV